MVVGNEDKLKKNEELSENISFSQELETLGDEIEEQAAVVEESRFDLSNLREYILWNSPRPKRKKRGRVQTFFWQSYENTYLDFYSRDEYKRDFWLEPKNTFPLRTLEFCKNELNKLPVDVRGIAMDKINENPIFTKRVLDKYNSLSWKERPDFLPFFCACKWYEKISPKPINWCLAIVDFSKTTLGYSRNKARKAWWNGFINEWKLFLINMNTNEITLTTDKSPQWWWWMSFSRRGPWFSDQEWSLKSSLWFTQVAVSKPNLNGSETRFQPHISPDGSTGPHVMLTWLESGINENTTIRNMYAHAWTFSEGCTVVPNDNPIYRQVFLNTLIWRDPQKPVLDGRTYRWQSRGIIFTYAPDKDYLENSRLV